MDKISILLVVVILGTMLFSLFSAWRSNQRQQSWAYRLATTAATLLLVLGLLGFFGAALASLGGMNWLPPSFEWPMGYATDITTCPDGNHVVPKIPVGRIQIYSANWTFLRGWQITAHGGTFDVACRTDGLIGVSTARGRYNHYLFRESGEIVSDAPPSAVWTEGSDVHYFSTSFWLLPFTHPFVGWAFGMTGMVFLAVLDKQKKKFQGKAQVGTDSSQTNPGDQQTGFTVVLWQVIRALFRH